MKPGAGKSTIILGGGLAGISAAMHLDHPYLLLDHGDRLGGLARTEERDGYFFDHTGHWLHLRDPDIQALVDRLLGNEMVEVTRKARVYSHGKILPYPFQANLHGLPADVVHECLLGFVNTLVARAQPSGTNVSLGPSAPHRREPENFEEYIFHHFGDGIAKHFMIPYNHKLWGVHPREITSAWCSRFVPIPNVEQVIAGAVGAGPGAIGYNTRFRYPKRGGIETVTKRLISELDDSQIRLGSTISRIRAARGQAYIGDTWHDFDTLISSIPLPKLVSLIEDAPDHIQSASQKLRATAVRYLNVGTRHPSPADYHWIYVPEKRLPFYRVGIFSNAMPTMAPPNCSSLYVELSNHAVNANAGAQDAIEALVEINAISDVNDVVFADLREINPAYVIFDHDYHQALETIQPYLASHNILSCGRYGAWIYNAMEDSLLAGKEAAQMANTRAQRCAEQRQES